MPVRLNPAFMFAGVMALFQAMLNTGKNSAFVIALQPTVQLNVFIWKLNSFLKVLNGFLSKGCGK